MKNLLFLLAFLSISTIQAQQFALAFEDDFHSITDRSVLLENGDLLVVGRMYDDDIPDSGIKWFVKRTNNTGNIIFEKTLDELEHAVAGWITDLVALSDGGYMLLGTAGDCSLGWGNIFRFNSENELTYFKGESPDSTFGLYNKIEVLPNGNYVLLFSNRVTVYDNDNQVIKDNIFNGFEKRASILISHDETMTLDTAGILTIYNIYSGNLTDVVDVVVEDNSGLYSLSPAHNSFYITSSTSSDVRFFRNYQEEVFTFNQSSGKQIKQNANGELLIFGDIDESSRYEKIYDAEWNIISDNIISDLPDTYAGRDILFTDDFIILSGTEYAYFHHRTGFVHKFPRTPANIESTPDLEITFIDFDRPVATTQLGNPTDSWFQELYEFENIEIEIRNAGTSVINRFSLNTIFEIPDASFCIRNHTYQEVYENLELLPNETMTISIAELAGSSTDPSSPFCMWTNAPNFQPDFQRDNDRYCKGFERNIVEMLNEDVEVVEEKSVLYPNPTNDLLFLDKNSWAISGTKYFVIDVHGKTVLDGKLSFSKMINTANLPKGLYILEVEADLQNRVIKFVKI